MLGILGIWLVYQLGVEGARFLELHLSFRVITLYYLAQIPYLVVMWMPLAALLGLLYVLTRMSRRNEIVAMLGAGRSVPPVFLPLFSFRRALTGVSLFFNYQLTPRGDHVLHHAL